MNEVKVQKNEDFVLEQMRLGDDRVVRSVYKSGYPSVHHYVTGNSGDSEEAAEIYQQAFIILLEKLQDPDFILNSAIGTYLFAVSRNLWMASLKERRRYVLGGGDGLDSMEADQDDFTGLIEREREYDAMELSLDLLGEPCKTLLKAFYHEMKSMEEIAAMMNYTNADNAKNQKYKCLVRLRKIFDKQSRMVVHNNIQDTNEDHGDENVE
jgi:RNA polymerase sigma factor (sigma-70 family)